MIVDTSTLILNSGEVSQFRPCDYWAEFRVDVVELVRSSAEMLTVR